MLKPHRKIRFLNSKVLKTHRKMTLLTSQSSIKAPSASRSPPDPSGTLLDCPGVSWSLPKHPLEPPRTSSLARFRVMESFRTHLYTKKKGGMGAPGLLTLYCSIAGFDAWNVFVWTFEDFKRSTNIWKNCWKQHYWKNCWKKNWLIGWRIIFNYLNWSNDVGW